MMLRKVPVVLISALALLSCGGKGDIGTDDKMPDPYIISVTTDYDGKAVAGKPVVLNGLNFSPDPAENKVLYGVGLDAVSLPVSESSEDHVVFMAPALEVFSLRIRVSVRGKESNHIILEYTTGSGGTDDDPWSDTPTIELPGAVTKQVLPGVEWTSFHGLWEGQIRNINIVRTTLDGHNSLGIYYNYTTEGLRNLDEKCIYLDAIAGTNGPMACCHFVRVDGVDMHGVSEQDPWIVNCAITIDDGVPDIVKVNDNYGARRLASKNVGCAGPLLVWEGKIQDYPSWNNEGFLITTHPRTAIGLSKDRKTVVQVAVDGRWTSSDAAKRAIGMSTALLGKLMLGLGCYKAMNFDGGGGTAMYVYGEGDCGIVNHPTDNNDWDHPHASLRPTGNAVYIKSDYKSTRQRASSDF